MVDDENTISTRLILELSAVSPIILLPVSSVSHSVLIADLGNLKVSNQLLMSSSPATIGSSSDPARGIFCVPHWFLFYIIIFLKLITLQEFGYMLISNSIHDNSDVKTLPISGLVSSRYRIRPTESHHK